MLMIGMLDFLLHYGYRYWIIQYSCLETDPPAADNDIVLFPSHETSYQLDLSTKYSQPGTLILSPTPFFFSPEL